MKRKITKEIRNPSIEVIYKVSEPNLSLEKGFMKYNQNQDKELNILMRNQCISYVKGKEIINTMLLEHLNQETIANLLVKFDQVIKGQNLKKIILNIHGNITTYYYEEIKFFIKKLFRKYKDKFFLWITLKENTISHTKIKELLYLGLVNIDIIIDLNNKEIEKTKYEDNFEFYNVLFSNLKEILNTISCPEELILRLRINVYTEDFDNFKLFLKYLEIQDIKELVYVYITSYQPFQEDTLFINHRLEPFYKYLKNLNFNIPIEYLLNKKEVSI